MGRAYEVRKASIQKTGAAKGKIYSMYAKEIYLAAKQGGTELESNASLKRLVERAKKEQVPGDIIKRAIDKVNSGADESYIKNTYEMFGPGGSTLIVECLTDNVNRSVSDLRAVVNKTHIKMGAMGSVSYMYDNNCVVSFKGLDEDAVMEALIMADIDADIEMQDDSVVVYGEPQDLFKIKDAIKAVKDDVNFDVDEITLIPKDTVTLAGDDKEVFDKLLTMLDDVEDVQNVYHNVNL
jgi:YebC/PmpR family DNA-binding regulatory protein